MLLKIAYLVSWMLIAGGLGISAVAALQQISRLGSVALRMVLAEVAMLVLLALPFFHIWYLTGILHANELISFVGGIRASHWIVILARRVFIGTRSIERETKTFILIGSIDPLGQTIGRMVPVLTGAHGIIFMLGYAAIYLSLDADAASPLMLRVLLISTPVVIALFVASNFIFLTMPHLSEHSRAILFKDVTLNLVPAFTSVILALYILYPGSIWAPAFSLQGVQFPLFAAVAVAAFATFLLIVVGPYTWGVISSKRARTALLLQRKRSAATTVDAILEGYWTGDVDLVDKALTQARKGLSKTERQHLIIANSEQARTRVTAPDASESALFTVEDLDLFCASDERIKLQRYMTDLVFNLEFASRILREGNDLVIQRQVLDHIILAGVRELSRTGDGLAEVERTKPALFATISSLLVGAASIVLSLLGKAFLDTVAKFLPSLVS